MLSINHVYIHSFRSIIEATESFPGMGAFDHLEWTYDGTFEQLFGPGGGNFEQKFFKNSNGRGIARGAGMFKLPFDWYIRCRNVFSEGKFRKVKRTFSTPSRQPLNRFS